jgi:hypothetical protein
MNRILPFAGLLLAANAVLACDADLVAEFRSTPPLLAHEPDTSLIVSLHRDGCVKSVFPRQDMRHGQFELALDRARHKHAVMDIDPNGLRGIAADDVRTRVKAGRHSRAKSGAMVYRVLDENVIEVVLPADGKSSAKRLRWTSLRDDLMNLPDDPDLLRLASAQQVFHELADQAAAEGARR